MRIGLLYSRPTTSSSTPQLRASSTKKFSTTSSSHTRFSYRRLPKYTSLNNNDTHSTISPDNCDFPVQQAIAQLPKMHLSKPPPLRRFRCRTCSAPPRRSKKSLTLASCSVHHRRLGQAHLHPEEGADRRGYQVSPPSALFSRRQVSTILRIIPNTSPYPSVPQWRLYVAKLWSPCEGYTSGGAFKAQDTLNTPMLTQFVAGGRASVLPSRSDMDC